MRALAVLLPLVVLTGCGHIAHQTRYLPRASQLTWDEDHEQLPWRPPALASNEHYPYHSNPQRPNAQYQAHYSVDHRVVNYHYPNDADERERDATPAEGQVRKAE